MLEMMIVIVIVAILAVITAPMMSGSVNRAKRAEAVAACGALRTIALIYLDENGAVPANIANIAAYVSNAELNGPNYSRADYSISGGLIKADAGVNGPGWVNLDINTNTLTQGSP